MAYYSDDSIRLFHGDALAVAREMESGSVDCIVTSPPYFSLRCEPVHAGRAEILEMT